MVHNYALECKICHNKIRLRYQVSEMDCPISFLCPNCMTRISGVVKFNNGHVLCLENANESVVENCNYCLELSSDFLISKIKKESNEFMLTPFLRQMKMLGMHNEDNTRFYLFLSKWYKNWQNLKVNLDLCHNGKYDILLERLGDKYAIFPKDIRAIMITHQELIMFLNSILPKNELTYYMELGNIILDLVKSNSVEFNKFLLIFNLKEVKNYETKLMELIKRFIDLYPKFLPIFNSLNLEISDDFGISTLTFEEIKTFYHDAYELILEISKELIALNNIITRGSINKFIDEEFDFIEKLKKDGKYNNYLKLFTDKDKLSWLMTYKLENHIRNSIGHFDYSENPITQLVKFTDQNKKRTNKVERYLIDLARDCVYMFFTIVNFLELNYNFIKIHTIYKMKNRSEN